LVRGSEAPAGPRLFLGNRKRRGSFYYAPSSGGGAAENYLLLETTEAFVLELLRCKSKHLIRLVGGRKKGRKDKMRPNVLRQIVNKKEEKRRGALSSETPLKEDPKRI